MSFQTNSRGLRLGSFRKWDISGFDELYNYSTNIFKYLNTQKYLETMLELSKHNIYLIKTNFIKLGTKKIYIIIYYHNLNLEDDRLYSLLLKRNETLIEKNEKKLNTKYQKLYKYFYKKKLSLRFKLQKKSIWLKKKHLKLHWNYLKSDIFKNRYNKIKYFFNQRFSFKKQSNKITSRKVYLSFFTNINKKKNKKFNKRFLKSKNNITKKKKKLYNKFITTKLYNLLRFKKLKKKKNNYILKNFNLHHKKNEHQLKNEKVGLKTTIKKYNINNGKKRLINIQTKKKKKRNIYYTFIKNIKQNYLKKKTLYFSNKTNMLTTKIAKKIKIKYKKNKNITYYVIKKKENKNRFTYNNLIQKIKHLNKFQNLKLKWYLYKFTITILKNFLFKKKNFLIYFFFKKIILNKKYTIYKKFNRIKSLQKKKKKIINLLNMKQLKKNLSILFNTNINIFAINAKNMLKFMLNNTDEKQYLYTLFKKSNKYYESILTNYIDIIYIFFYTFLFKDAKILTKLIVFIFNKKRRYIRDGSIINFIRQVLPTVINHFPDVDAVRIKIKGRLNNRKRTRTDFIRHNLVTNHKISYFTDYDSTFFITSSGALGFKIWISFVPEAKQNHIKLFKKYLLYSKLKNDKKI